MKISVPDLGFSCMPTSHTVAPHQKETVQTTLMILWFNLLAKSVSKNALIKKDHETTIFSSTKSISK